MIQQTSKLFILFLCIITFSSCERTVSFKLSPSAEKVVVEGTIENGQAPFVRFSKSIGFFSNVNIDTLAKTFLHGAEMTVSDGIITIPLKEYAIPFDSIIAYIYTIDTANPQSLNFKGEVGKRYTLTIKYQGKTYTSTTIIPALIPLDSIWSKVPPEAEIPDDLPNAMEVWAQYKDPDTPGNKARYFTSINGGPFLAPFFSTYDDDVINGTSVQFQLPAGVNKMDTSKNTLLGYYTKGDTVIVKWCSIDESVYHFWRTLDYSYGTAGNPFSTPVEISTNISNGALGVWQGYGATYDTLVIPQ